MMRWGIFYGMEQNETEVRSIKCGTEVQYTEQKYYMYVAAD